MPENINVMEVFILTFLIMLLANKGKGSEQRFCWYTSRKVGPLVVHQIETPSDYVNNLEQDIGQIQGFNQTCPKRTNYCYALWKEEQLNQSMNQVIIIAQGCWKTSGKQDCDRENCAARRKSPEALNNTNFCCCRGNFCNGNVTQMHSSEEADSNLDILPTPAVKYAEKPYILVLVVLLILFLFTSSCFPVLIILSRGLHKKKEENDDLNQNSCQDLGQDSVHLMENGNLNSSGFNFEGLQLEKIIGKGRYGVVWKGNLGSQEVAVKICSSQYKNNFCNEVDIYSENFMTHSSLLTYLGFEERINRDGGTEYFLVLSLAPNGPLQDYLRSNVLDWNIFCKMVLSIAKGLAYLHTDIKKGEQSKPCICHRDLTTKNILLKEDLSCVICDFGFAIKIKPEQEDIDVSKMMIVGTLRYMAPEILDGALNLRDLETSLKQIDVYCLGLILWEISTRCKDFYPSGIECVPYRPPYEAEIGHPTIDQMKTLVSKHKARPLFPDLWKDTLAVRSIKETIEDCWDNDAEARLTALCVEERLHELCGITERQRISLYCGGFGSTFRTSLIQKDSQNVLIVGDNKEGSCASETTAETTMAITPANIQASSKNSNLYQGIYASVQPYQGRNPCLERNLMVSHDMESTGVELIDKSQKNISPNRSESSSVFSDFLNIYPLNLTNQNFPSSVCSGLVNHSEPLIRCNAPIPFLQNMNSECIEPKQLNIVKRDCQRKKISWKNFRAFFEKKQSAEDLTQIDCNISINLIANEHFVNLPTPTFANGPRTETQISLSNGKPETKIAAKDDSTFSKILNFAKPETDSLESTTSFLIQKNNKRPDTLHIVKNTEFLNTDMSNGQDFDKFLKNVQGFSVGQNGSKGCKNYHNSTQIELRDDYTNKAVNLVEIEEMDYMDSDGMASPVQIREFNSKKPNVIDGYPSREKLVTKIGKESSDNMYLTNKLYSNCNLSEKYLTSQRENEVHLKNSRLGRKSLSLGNLYKAIGQAESGKQCTRLSLSNDRIISCYYDSETLLKNTNKGQDGKLSFHENIQFNPSV